MSPSFRRSPRLESAPRPAPSHEQPWDHPRAAMGSPPRPRRHQQETEERLNPNAESVATSNVDVVRPPRRRHRHRYANVPCAVPSGNRRSTSCGSCLSSAHRFRHMSVCFGLERAGGGEGGNGRARQGACRWSATSFPVCSSGHRWWSAAVGAGPCLGPPLAVILRRNIDTLQPCPSFSTRATRMHGGHAVHHPRQPPSPLAGTDAS